MVAEGLLFAGVLEPTRPPNPYKRIYHLYDLCDLGPTGVLSSDNLSWVWNMLPLALVSAALLLSLRWF